MLKYHSKEREGQMNFKKPFFSISIYETEIFKRWILHIFGFKVASHEKKKKIDRPTLFNRETTRLAIRANRNLVSYIVTYLPKTSEEHLFCLKNNEVCYVFNKKVLEWGEDFFKSFLLNSPYQLQWLCTFNQLSPDSELYKEHMARFKKGEFLWKYVKQRHIIVHKFISMDKNKQAFVHQQILDDSFVIKNSKTPYFLVKNSKRPFYKGSTVSSALVGKTFEEKKKIFIDLIEYIFKNFSLPDGKIEARLYDCHLSNFILDEKGVYHFIDDDYISPKPLSKKYIIKRILAHDIGTKLYWEIFDYFKMLPKHFTFLEREKTLFEEMCNKYFG